METIDGEMWQHADVVVVGAELSGLVSAAAAYNAGRTVLVLDQESETSLGGRAHCSFGGLFLVDSPEQRRPGVKDSTLLARSDWMGSAAFDRTEDEWPRRWAEAFVDFAAGENRAWLHTLGVRFFPLVQWAEHGGYDAQGHGNSVPRFHVLWGTGPGILAPFIAKIQEGVVAGKVHYAFRHRATSLMFDAGSVTGVRGQRLAPSPVERGQVSSREVAGDFSVSAGAVIVTTGGIGGNHPMVRE